MSKREAIHQHILGLYNNNGSSNNEEGATDGAAGHGDDRLDGRNNKRRRIGNDNSADASHHADEASERTTDQRFETIWRALTSKGSADPHRDDPFLSFHADDWQTLHDRGFTWNELDAYVRSFDHRSKQVKIGPIVIESARSFPYELPDSKQHFFCSGIRVYSSHHDSEPVGRAVAGEEADGNASGNHGQSTNVTQGTKVDELANLRVHLMGLVQLMEPIAIQLYMECRSDLFLQVIRSFSHRMAFRMMNIKACVTTLDDDTSAWLVCNHCVLLSTRNLPEKGVPFFRALGVSKGSNHRMPYKLSELEITMSRGVEIDHEAFANAIKAATCLQSICINNLRDGAPYSAWPALFEGISASKSITQICIAHHNLAHSSHPSTDDQPHGWIDAFLLLLQSQNIQKISFGMAYVEQSDEIRERNGRRICNAMKKNQIITSLKMPGTLVNLKILYYDIEILLRINIMRKKLKPIVMSVAGDRNMKLIARLLARRTVRKNLDMIYEILQMSNDLLSSGG